MKTKVVFVWFPKGTTKPGQTLEVEMRHVPRFDESIDIGYRGKRWCGRVTSVETYVRDAGDHVLITLS